MPRYIDADIAIGECEAIKDLAQKVIDEELAHIPEKRNQIRLSNAYTRRREAEDTISRLRNQPAADVEEVRHSDEPD